MKPILVAIVGGSGSGKSWLAEKLQQELGTKLASHISLDDFYIDRSHLSVLRRANINFDHPRSIDWQSFEQVLKDALAGRPMRLPCYDFSTHRRLPKPKVLEPKPIIIVEGLWLLRSPSIRKLFSFSIFLNCCTRTRLSRRLARDVQSRGRDPRSIREQFRLTVEPMHRQYVAPQRRFADLALKEHLGSREINQVAALLKARLQPGQQRSPASSPKGTHDNSPAVSTPGSHVKKP